MSSVCVDRVYGIEKSVIHVLSSPAEFYDELLVLVRGAARRISISADSDRKNEHSRWGHMTIRVALYKNYFFRILVVSI